MRRIVMAGVTAAALVLGGSPALAVDSTAEGSSSGAATTQTITTQGAPFVALTPSRLMDTRAGQQTVDGRDAGTGALAKEGVRELQVSGRGGVPAIGAGAVVLNVTATRALTGGHLTAWPTGELRPNTSIVNYAAGQTSPNAVVVKLGKDGKVSLYSSSVVDAIVDVGGWFPEGSGVSPLVPARLMDARKTGGQTIDGQAKGAGPSVKGATIPLVVAGRGGVPSGAAAVLLNVTAISAAANGFVTAWPAGAVRPPTSNLNVAPGRIVPGLAMVPVGRDGTVNLYTSVSTTLLVDVMGWFPTGAAVAPLQPARLMDTRDIGTTADGEFDKSGITRKDVPVDLQVTGRGGVPQTGVGAVVLNVTVPVSAAPGHVTVWPSGQPVPNASSVNFAPGRVSSNLVIAKIGLGGRVSLATAQPAYLIVDVMGWFGDKVIDGGVLTVPDTTTFVGAGDIVGGLEPGPQALQQVVRLSRSADTVKVGDHLAVASTPTTPQGAMGRVVSLSPQSDGTQKAVVEPARLQDAVPVGSVDYSGPLDALAGAPATDALRQSLLKGLGMSCGGGLQIGGGIDLGVDVDLHLKWGNGADEARVVFKAELALSARLNGGVDLECEVEGPSFVGWSVPVGPVVLAFSARPYAKIAGKATVMRAEVGLALSSEIGFTTQNGALVPVNSSSVTPSVVPLTFSQPSAEFSVSLGFKIEALAYKVVGVTVSAGPELSYEVSREGSAYSCTASLAARVAGSAKIDYWFGALEAELGSAVVGSTDLGRSGCGSEAPPVITTAALETILTGSTYFQRLTATSPLEPVTWGVEGLPPGMSLNGSVLGGSPNQAGTYQVTLKATDLAGQTTRKTLPLVVGQSTAATDALKGRIAQVGSETWYVDLRGTRHVIRDGGVFECIKAQGKAVVPTDSATVAQLGNPLEDAQCVRAVVGQLVTVDQDSYLIGAGFTRRSVVDGRTYECLRANGSSPYESRVPRYWLTDLALGDDIRNDCWNATTARGRTVRADNGRSYYVDLRGQRHHVPDTGTYDCLIQQGKADYGQRIPAGLVESLPASSEDAVCVRVDQGQVVQFYGQTWYIDTGFVRRLITDGISYECATLNGHPDRGGVPSYWLNDLNRGADYTYHCWNKDAAKGKVVRFSDNSSWYVDLRGDRHSVPDGGTYECIKAQRGDYGVVVPAHRLVEMTAQEGAQCVRANPGNIVKLGADSYLLGAQFQRQRITNGITFQCLTANATGVYSPDVPRYWLLDLPGGADYTWNCWDRPRASGKVVRGSDNRSWYVDKRGTRHHIPSTGIYDCLVQQVGDYGYRVPAASLDELGNPAEDAECVRPGAGQMLKHHTDPDSYTWTGSQLRHIQTGAAFNCLVVRGHGGLAGVPRYWILDQSRAADHTNANSCNLIVTHRAGNDSHWITPEGQRRYIETVEVYNCLAASRPRFFTDSRTLIDTGWQQVDHARC